MSPESKIFRETIQLAMNKILTLLFFSFCWLFSKAQWQYTGSSNTVQPLFYEVKAVGEKIYVYGPTLAADSTPNFVQLHCSEFDMNGNKIFDTLIGSTLETYHAFTLRQNTYYSKSTILVRKRYPTQGQQVFNDMGIILDTNYSITEIPLFTELPIFQYYYGLVFKQTDLNEFVVAMSLVYPTDNFSENHLHFRVFDSLGNVSKEKVIELGNRQFICTDWVLHEGHYYLSVIRTQVGATFGQPDLNKAIIYKLDTADLNIVEQYIHPGLIHLFDAITVENDSIYVGGIKLMEVSDSGDQILSKIIMKFDDNLNFIWENTVGIQSFGPEIVGLYPTGNDDIIGIGSELLFYENSGSDGAACLFSIAPDGTTNWLRYFLAVANPEIGTTNKSYGFAALEDGGYLICGAGTGSFPYMSRGFVARTNCLGFIGPPQAALAHEFLENHQINFTNNSTEAGSFTWFMDDGAVYETTEHDGNIQHTFDDLTIEHTVTLIAHGCDGEADTLVYVIPIHPDFLPEPPIEPEPIIPENGFFAIYPNPAQVGAPINIVMNAQANAEKIVFEFHNSAGQLAASYEVPNQSGVLMFQNEFAQGLYHVSMKVDGKGVAKKKFVVSG